MYKLHKYSLLPSHVPNLSLLSPLQSTKRGTVSYTEVRHTQRSAGDVPRDKESVLYSELNVDKVYTLSLPFHVWYGHYISQCTSCCEYVYHVMTHMYMDNVVSQGMLCFALKYGSIVIRTCMCVCTYTCMYLCSIIMQNYVHVGLSFMLSCLCYAVCELKRTSTNIMEACSVGVVTGWVSDEPHTCLGYSACVQEIGNHCLIISPEGCC